MRLDKEVDGASSIQRSLGLSLVYISALRTFISLDHDVFNVRRRKSVQVNTFLPVDYHSYTSSSRQASRDSFPGCDVQAIDRYPSCSGNRSYDSDRSQNTREQTGGPDILSISRCWHLAWVWRDWRAFCCMRCSPKCTNRMAYFAQVFDGCYLRLW
jgi:hypothetical protein